MHCSGMLFNDGTDQLVSLDAINSALSALQRHPDPVFAKRHAVLHPEIPGPRL